MAFCAISATVAFFFSMEIVGNLALLVQGLAPHSKLQNINGDNWKVPPLGCNYVTYTYFDEDSKELQRIEELAASYKAVFRYERVRVDKGRVARLVYHTNGDIPNGLTTVLLVLQTGENDVRYLRLVQIPTLIQPSNLADERPRPKMLLQFSQ